MAKPVRTTKQGQIKTTHAQGIGYFIPDSMDNKDWHRIKQIWDQKLNDSGFIDIEQFSHALDGHFLPTLLNNSIEKNQKLQRGAIGDGIAGYFDYCSTYYEHCNWMRTFDKRRFGRKWRLMREIFRLHKDGVSYSDMRSALQGKQTKYMKRFSIRASYKHHWQKRSKYWCFDKTRIILEQMWLWHATHELGALTPYDLEHMQSTGITPAIIELAKRLAPARSVLASTTVAD